jgi:hypothetical protein
MLFTGRDLADGTTSELCIDITDLKMPTKRCCRDP